MISLTDVLNKYKELNKSFIYDVLKSDIPFSNEKKWNKRYFTEEDIEKFLYIKNNNLEKAIKKYWKNSLKQFEYNSIKNNINTDNSADKTVWNTDFKQKINELEEVIIEKSKEITRVETWNIKLNEINKVAKEDKEIERQEKNNWISKYEKLNEKYEWINIINTKLKMILYFLIFMLLVFFLTGYLYFKWLNY